MEDTQFVGARSRREEVLEAFRERHEQDGVPFGDAREFLYFMQRV